MAGNVIIPKNERELAEASEGDVVQISYDNDKGSYERRLTILHSRVDDNYHFMEQLVAQYPEDADLVRIHTCPFAAISFDRNLGAILSRFRDVNFRGPHREEYRGMVDSLRNAGLWKDKKNR